GTRRATFSPRAGTQAQFQWGVGGAYEEGASDFKRRTFDARSFLTVATGVEVFRVASEKRCIARRLQTIHQIGAVMRSREIGPERPLPGFLELAPVFSPSRITLENNGKIRPQPDRQNAFAGASGGGDGTGIQPSPLAKSLLHWPQISVSK
ncbi:MAG: hypothetical protein JJU40_04945, partial [Rhodobacteraceae bacterium]|nr:hypothetical protein [Paracoccaceae bacterium]